MYSVSGLNSLPFLLALQAYPENKLFSQLKLFSEDVPVA